MGNICPSTKYRSGGKGRNTDDPALIIDDHKEQGMAKVIIKELVKRLLPQYADCIKLISYIYNVQQTKVARLDFSATAKVLGADWKTVKRLCDKLAKAEVVYYEGDGLRLNPDVITTD